MLLHGATLLLLFAMFGCASDPLGQKHERLFKTKIETISESDILSKLEYVGMAEGNSSVALSFNSIGIIEKINVEEGQRVSKGQLLAKLDPTSAQNIFNAAESSLKQAKDAYTRLKSIYDNGSLPEIQMVDIEAKLQQAQSACNIAKKSLDDCSLYSPINGVVGKKLAEAGENAVIGKPVLTLVDISSVKVKFSVPENEIPAIPANSPSTVTVSALGGKKFYGSGIEKGVLANAVSHTYPTRVSLPNPDHDLLPGMVCKVEVSLSNTVQSIVVPIGVVQASSDGRKFVWGEQEGKAKRLYVETGEARGNGVEIKSGLAPGNRIVTEGYQKISEGDKITGK
jgi:membrane fusion protein, multidrug efflux system